MIITMSHEVVENDICEVSGSKIAKLGSIEDGYKRSSIHVVGDKSYMGIP
jgi:hypothetical protein